MSTDPVRLHVLEGASDLERQLLEAGRMEAPAAYDMAAGAERFQRELAAIAPSPSPGAASRAAGQATFGKLALKLVVGAVIAGAGVSAVWISSRSFSAARAPVSTAGTAVNPEVAAQPAIIPFVPAGMEQEVARTSNSPVAAAQAKRVRQPRRPTRDTEMRTPRTPEPTPAAASVSASVSSSLVAPTVSTRPSSAAVAPPPEPAEQREEALDGSFAQRELLVVARARKLLDRDPQAALDTLDELRREHVTGYFVEERRGLTVLALLGTGRRAVGREQGAAFLRAYPDGPLADRVRRALSAL